MSRLAKDSARRSRANMGAGESRADGGPPAGSSAGGVPTGGCPVQHQSPHPDASGLPPSECPAARHLNPANQMPQVPEQHKWPGQKQDLSKERVVSGIPKGGGDTWTYPSPQMFYNAVKRKGKDDNVKEDDMDLVVAIHNSMNERTWEAVLEWERRHSECDKPTLKCFKGRDHEPSPKARLKTLLGCPKPFDRHDWIIDRCGREVRYVIDYYMDHRAQPEAFSQWPRMDAPSAPSPVIVDVRPALDDLQSVYDRLCMFPSRAWAAAVRGLPRPPPRPTPEQLAQLEQEQLAAAQRQAEAAEAVERVRSQCGKAFAAVTACKGPKDCRVASTQLNLCLAEACGACQDEAQAYRTIAAGTTTWWGTKRVDQKAEEQAFEALGECLRTYASAAV